METRRTLSLLTLCVWIGAAAANCPQPKGAENMIPVETSLLQNDFPEGSEVTLICGNGYKKESGSGVINCIDDKWTEPDLICKMKDCGPPKAQPHMNFDLSEGTLFRAKIIVMCEEGYQISGSSYRHCYDRGWFGKATCNVITCAEPPEVENGQSSWNAGSKPEYGQIINFTCNAGFLMLGNKSIQCSKTGKYDFQPPQCIGVTKEDKITTEILTSAPATAEQETSTAKGLTATAVTARASTIISTLNKEDNSTTTASVPTSTSLKDKNIETPDIDKSKGYAPVIISVITVTLVFCILAIILNKFLMRKKGSYDTGEDLKPELLQFQSL